MKRHYFQLSLQVYFIVMFRVRLIFYRLSILGHHDDGCLKSGYHRKHEVQKDIGVWCSSYHPRRRTRTRPSSSIKFRFTKPRTKGIRLDRLHRPLMKQVKSEPQNRRISNVECRRMESLRSVFYKLDRSTQKLTTGGIHYSTFDVERSVFDLPAMPWKRCGVNLANCFIDQ
jgi:hypothetical protein